MVVKSTGRENTILKRSLRHTTYLCLFPIHILWQTTQCHSALGEVFYDQMMITSGWWDLKGMQMCSLMEHPFTYEKQHYYKTDPFRSKWQAKWASQYLPGS